MFFNGKQQFDLPQRVQSIFAQRPLGLHLISTDAKFFGNYLFDLFESCHHGTLPMQADKGTATGILIFSAGIVYLAACQQ